MLYFGEIRLLIPGGRGSLGLLVSGPIAWVHYLFYIFFCTWIITVSLDYLYGEDAKGQRDKVSDWSGMTALSFYVLTFMLFHLFGPDGEGIPRYKLFGSTIICAARHYGAFICSMYVLRPASSPFFPGRSNMS